MQSKPIPGIRVRHSRKCPTHSGGRCDATRQNGCVPTFEAWIFDKSAIILDKQGNPKRDEKGAPLKGAKIRKRFASLKDAKEWRQEAVVAVRKRKLRAAPAVTLREAATTWLSGAERGEILSRRKLPYKPSTLRGYKADLDTYVFPDLGALRLGDVSGDDVQALVERLIGSGLSGSKVRNVVACVQAVYRHRRRQVLANPTTALDLPEASGRRERAATPVEAAALLEALPNGALRAVYTCAFLAGLRRGELMALRVCDLHGLDEGSLASIAVEGSWDPVAGRGSTKSRAGVREVPVPETLRDVLTEHVESTGRTGAMLVFGRTASEPFTPSHVRKSAIAAWTGANTKEAAKAAEEGTAPAVLNAIGLHECRHSYSTFLDAAGISESRADRYMGHSDSRVQATYRHQLAGQLADDAARLDAYLTGAASGKVVALTTAAA